MTRTSPLIQNDGVSSYGGDHAYFVLSGRGVVLMISLLALALTAPSGAQTYGPVTGAAGGVALLGLLVFLVSVLRELVRKPA